ncbi:hypothetical protein ACIGN6_30645 [Streptomyces sp. NPDC053792]|uniref:hypothetical protein n=1 Tax=Streptomyces sp. NPDC053792 TaxID=3365716 RepID=UPI0037D903A9
MMKRIKNFSVAVAASALVALVLFGGTTAAGDSALQADPNWDSAPVDISRFEDPTQI